MQHAAHRSWLSEVPHGRSVRLWFREGFARMEATRRTERGALRRQEPMRERGSEASAKLPF